MLTVIREVHEAVGARVADMEGAELGPAADDSAQDAMLAELMAIAITAGQTALERTPQQLEVLAEAGRRRRRRLRADRDPRRPRRRPQRSRGGRLAGPAPVGGQSRGRPPHQLALPVLHQLHRHRHRARPALDRASAGGARRLGRRRRRRDDAQGPRPRRRPRPRARRSARSTATSISSRRPTCTPRSPPVTRGTAWRSRPPTRRARAPEWSPSPRGPGLTELFGAEGASVVDGGSTLNPSIQEILAGIRSAPGEEVIVLPNSPNVVMAATEAAKLAERPAHVVSSTAQQAGLAALVGAFDASRERGRERRAARGRAAGDHDGARRRGRPRRRRRPLQPRRRRRVPRRRADRVGRSGHDARGGRRRLRRRRDRHRDRGGRAPRWRASELEIAATGAPRSRSWTAASPPTGG